MAAFDPDRAERIIEEAKRAYRITAGRYEQDVGLAAVARASAATDPDRAEYIAASIAEEYWRPVALAGLAQVWLEER